MREKIRNRSAVAVIEEAAEWIVRLSGDDVTQDERREFVAWLKQSPVHIREYLRAESSWNDLQEVDPERRLDAREQLKEVDWNVVELHPGSAAMAGKDVERRRRTLPLAWAAAVATLAVGIALLIGVRGTGDSYSTKVGEQRIVRLADGSTVTLNTATSVKVELSDAARIVQLEQGEALFKVAKDSSRPFRVISNDAVAQAIGTTFSVRRASEGTVVTVLEGTVAVARPEDLTTLHSIEVPKLAIRIDGGQRAEVREEAIRTAAVKNPEAVVAWRNRRLIFDDQPLSEVAAEFNRYNELKLTVEDTALARERISGVFDADQPMTLVRFLESSHAIAPTRLEGGQVLLAPPLAITSADAR